MQRRALEFLRCPLCTSQVQLSEDGDGEPAAEVWTGTLVCSRGHRFPIVGGIPRLLPDPVHAGADGSRTRASLAGGGPAPAVRRTLESFSREWAKQSVADRTWYTDLRARVEGVFLEALRIPLDELAEMVVLDAGCGNGNQSVAYSEFVRDVIAIDLSTGVELGQQFRAQAEQHWPGARPERVHFVQADLNSPPLAPASMDIIHSLGVLHHTPDTYASFKSLVTLLRPGGTLYVWVYRYEPVVTPLLKALRAITTRLPVAVLDKLTQVMALPFVGLTRLLDRSNLRSYPSMSRQEAAVGLMDVFGPPYAHYHSVSEVGDWFRSSGFEDIWTCTEVRRGFAVCGRLKSASA